MCGSFSRAKWQSKRFHARSSLGRLTCIFAGTALLLANVLLAAPDDKPAGEKPAAQKESGETKTDENESELRQAARKLATAIKLTALTGGERNDLEIVQQPILRYGDLARNNDRGSVWIWQRSGRPQAIMELFRGADSQAWVEVIHSLSPDALEGDFGNQAPRWLPPAAGVQWNVLADAPVPAERPAARTRQIKELAQKFTAHEFWDPNNSRFELRLLVEPAYKYSDADRGLLDGAVFLLCHGTNPEVVLLIEAFKESEAAKYRYELARLGHAEMHAEFDQKEVWRQERVANTSTRDAYWLLFRGANP